MAVVYAVMIETRQSETPLGKMILAACFINDLGTVLALGLIFANFNLWLLVFVIVTCVMLWFMPKWTEFIVVRMGATRVSEPEIKFIFFVLFFLGGLASTAKSEAVLPAYLIGLVVAGVFLRDKTLVHRMRSIAFADVHAVLLHSRRLVRVAAGALDRAGRHRGVAGAEDGHQVRRRAAVVADVLHALARGQLHHAADVHRADLRHDFRAVRAAKQDH